MAFTANDIKSLVRKGWNGKQTHIEYEKNFVNDKSRGYLAGFGLQFKPGGSIRWILRYRVKERTGDSLHDFKAVRGKDRKKTIDSYPAMTLSTARSEAKKLLGEVDSGVDPLDRTEEPGLTLREWSATYLQDKRDKDFRSVNEMARRINRHILPALGHKRMVDISASNVYDLHKKVGGGPGSPTYEANRVLSRLSDLFTRARKAGKLPKGFVNPCLDVEAFPETPRERVLSTEEAQALVDAIARTEHQRFEALTWLLILTGIRISEARTLRWDDIELLGPAPRMSIHRTIAKNKQTHYVALNAGAVLVLNQVQREQGNDFVFPSPQRTNQPYANQPFKKVWDRVRQEADLWEGDKRIRWHDLRRTFLAIGNALNYPLHTLGRLVNQKTLSVTADYAQVAVETTRLATNSISSKILSDLGEPTISNRTRTRT